MILLLLWSMILLFLWSILLCPEDWITATRCSLVYTRNYCINSNKYTICQSELSRRPFLFCIYVYLTPLVKRQLPVYLSSPASVGGCVTTVSGRRQSPGLQVGYLVSTGLHSSLLCPYLHNQVVDQKEEEWGQQATLSNSSLHFEMLRQLSTMYYAATCSFISLLNQVQFHEYSCCPHNSPQDGWRPDFHLPNCMKCPPPTPEESSDP